MRMPSFLKKDSEQDKSTVRCNVCRMSFHSKESLEIHKKKANHFGGSIYFGKQD
jgi:hypothetical protein